MEPKSMKFIYQAMNPIAGRKHDAETEQCLADEIERELLAINPHVVLEQRKEITPSFPHVQAGLGEVRTQLLRGLEIPQSEAKLSAEFRDTGVPLLLRG
jgi:hypothetical protein